MQPIVAVIAPGMMGSAVGQRLVENGIEVRTLLSGRSEATVARAKAAGMVGVADEQAAAATSSCRSCRPAMRWASPNGWPPRCVPRRRSRSSSIATRSIPARSWASHG